MEHIDPSTDRQQLPPTLILSCGNCGEPPSRWSGPPLGPDGKRCEDRERYKAWLYGEIGAGRITRELLAREVSGKEIHCSCGASPYQAGVLEVAAMHAWVEGCLSKPLPDSPGKVTNARERRRARRARLS